MNNNTVSREVFEGFSGLGQSACGKTSCRLDNFRVLADGSLEKREGIRQLASLKGDVRGVCSVFENGEDVILAVVGNSLYRIGRDGKILSAACLSTESGEIGFFTYGGSLYLMDGAEIYRYAGKGVAKKVQGYTPLYGKNWSTYTTEDHFINEPINCFSPHIRLHFQVVESTKELHIGFKVEGVDWVMVDGVMMDPSRYSLDSAKDSVEFPVLVYASEIEVSLTLPESKYQDDEFDSCRSAAVYENFEASRVFFYGGRASAKFFVSKKVDTKALVKDRELFSNSCGLYFPKDKSFSLENGQPITAIHRLFDRMLLFFPSSLWASEPLDEVARDEILFSPICGHLGCSASHAVVMTGASSPISVARSGIYLWKIDPDLLDECITRCISDELIPFLEDSFFTGAGICHHRRRGELWFYDPSGKDGRLFLYSLDRKMWYCYSSISVDRMFTFGGGVGFTKGGAVCIFDEELSVDRLADGESRIEAVFESGWLDFGGADADKRLESILLTAELLGGELSASLHDGELLAEEGFFGTDPISSWIYERRAPTGRYRAAKLRLSACGPIRERIYRAELLAQKGKK